MYGQGQIPILILKEGTERSKGRDAQKNNITAAMIVGETVKTTLGPKGMDKMLVDSFGDVTITEDELWNNYDGKIPKGKIVIKDRIADNMFQQILTRTDEYDVLALPNLNGDYLSDAAAALIGGLGIAPGSNIGDGMGVFEPVHGTAPDIAGKGLANPTAMILAGSMLLEYLGFGEAQEVIIAALKRVLESGKVTKDLALLMGREKYLSTGEFSEKILEAIEKDTV